MISTEGAGRCCRETPNRHTKKEHKEIKKSITKCAKLDSELPSRIQPILIFLLSSLWLSFVLLYPLFIIILQLMFVYVTLYDVT